MPNDDWKMIPAFPIAASPRPRVLILGLLLFNFVCTQTLISQTRSPAKPAKIVTGHYRLRHPETPNSLEVLQLPAGKIQFHLLALWVSPNNRENVHNGELEGVIELKDNTATYETETCRVTIRFFSTTAIVTQDSKIGDCDFGVNVTASGIYRKINSRKPKFDNQGLISKHNQQSEPALFWRQHALQTIRTHRLGSKRDGLRDVGDGRLVKLRRP